MPSFNIILPCYNPHKGWKEAMLHSFNAIQKRNELHTFKIILVNDGSQKGFNIDKLNTSDDLKLVNLPENRGKGFALREGVKQAAHCDYYIYTDIDFPYTEESFQNVIDELLRGKTNIAAGVRDQNYYANVPATRKMISKFLRWLMKKLLRLQITDTQCGLKGFDKTGREIFLRTTINRFLFDMEFIFLASHNKDVILTPIQVDLKKNIVFSEVNMKILFKESANFLKILIYSLTNKK